MTEAGCRSVLCSRYVRWRAVAAAARSVKVPVFVDLVQPVVLSLRVIRRAVRGAKLNHDRFESLAAAHQ